MAETTNPETETPKSAGRKKAAAAVDAIATKIESAEQSLIDATEKAKSRFGKAIDEALASAETLKQDATDKAAAYKDKVAGATGQWTEQASVYAGQAKEKGTALANEGKARTSDALSLLGKSISETAPKIDEKLGVQYGDYARTAARTLQESAAKLEAKELAELGEDIKDVVRKSPAVAVGVAAVAGFLLARLFKGSADD